MRKYWLLVILLFITPVRAAVITSTDPNTYEVVLRGDKVEIGDKAASKFKPHIKLNRWGQECFIKCSIPDDGHSSLVTDPNKIKWVNTKTESHFYPLGEDGFEWEIILKEKPASNVVTINIETQGLDFFYQPELTQEEIDNGAIRPENVVGSYAVYHAAKQSRHTSKEDAEKYRTGKAFHIYRPKIVDSNNVSVWGKLSIEGGLLTVEIPQEFLDNAVYPVHHAAGLTFGYESIGASTFPIGNRITGSKFTGAAGTATSITAYLAHSGIDTVKHKYALYKDSDDSLLGGTNENDNSSSGWLQLTFASGPTIEAVDYYIVAWSEAVVGPICFFPGSLVQTPNGDRKIEDMKVGDELYSYDLENNEKITNRVMGTLSALHEKYTINEVLKASENQKIYIKGKGYIRADTIEIGDLMLNFDGAFVPVVSIDIDHKKAISYDLGVRPPHNYFVENFLVHNPTSQKSLYYDSTGGTGGYDSQTYGAWPDPWAQTSDGTRKYSIYCTYTASGGVVVTPYYYLH